MTLLQEYSLFEAHHETGTYSLHTCVHDWTLDWLNRKIRIDLFRFGMHCVAESVVVESEPQYWERNQPLGAHAMRFQHPRLIQVDLEDEYSEGQLRDLHMIAYLNKAQGRLEEAREMYQRVVKGHEKVLGAEHPATLTSVSNLALVLQRQGKYEAAEEMNQRALKGCEKLLGAEHPDTLTNINNLALVLQCQGKHEAAEKMNQQALKGREKLLGAEHPDTLSSVSNLALVLQRQGKYEAAEEMYQRVLKGHEKVLGVEHPDTLNNV